MEHDTTPEERNAAYQPLIAALRYGLRAIEPIPPAEQTRIIARARERLDRTGAFAPQAGPAGRPTLTSAPPIIPTTRRTRPAHVARQVTAVLLTGALVAAALLLFNLPTWHGASRPPVTTGPGAETRAAGLRASLHVLTPGPYFFSELLAVDVAATNQSGDELTLIGLDRSDNTCSSAALNVQATGGTAPAYTLPKLEIGCLSILYTTRMKPGQSLLLHYFLPLTTSGAVTIAMTVGILGVDNPAQPHSSHLRWPSVSIQVAPRVPANRILTLRAQGARLTVQGPSAALAHLLYRETISCDQYGAGGPLVWTPLPAPALTQPACPAPHKHWIYMVSAPGYAIAYGARDS